LVSACALNQGGVSDEALDGGQDEVQLLAYLGGDDLGVLHSGGDDENGGEESGSYRKDRDVNEDFNEGETT